MSAEPKEKRVAIIYRMPSDLHKQIVREAKRQDRSINNTLTYLIKTALRKTGDR